MAIKELNRKRRGHAFYPPKAVAKKIPALGKTDGEGDDAVVHLHYFSGAADWYITELDVESGMSFGWAEMFPGGGEWGYTDLVEVEAVNTGLVVIERDLHWEPKPMRTALADRVMHLYH